MNDGWRSIDRWWHRESLCWLAVHGTLPLIWSFRQQKLIHAARKASCLANRWCYAFAHIRICLRLTTLIRTTTTTHGRRSMANVRLTTERRRVRRLTRFCAFKSIYMHRPACTKLISRSKVNVNAVNFWLQLTSLPEAAIVNHNTQNCVMSLTLHASITGSLDWVCAWTFAKHF